MTGRAAINVTPTTPDELRAWTRAGARAEDVHERSARRARSLDDSEIAVLLRALARRRERRGRES